MSRFELPTSIPLRLSRIALLLLVIGSLTNGSVRGQELPNEYGGWSGSASRESLNGFSALAKLFEASGSRVQTWKHLTPTIERFNSIVWIPSGNRDATENEARRLEEWLANGSDRTLILVLKDYDATRDYLEAVLPSVQGEQGEAFRREWELMVAREQTQRLETGIGASPQFVSPQPRTGRKLGRWLGGPWAQGLSGPTHLVVHRDLKLPLSTVAGMPSTNVLLTVDGQPFVYELHDVEKYPDSRVIVVANGSFLVNYGFVAAGNRTLAERLVETTLPGEPVLFLESGDREMVVSDEEENQPSVWKWIQAWPISFLFPHAILAAVLTYFVYVPILGRPRRLSPPSRSDLGQHVDSIAALHQRAGDPSRATRILTNYRENVRQESRGLGAAASRRRRKP